MHPIRGQARTTQAIQSKKAKKFLSTDGAMSGSPVSAQREGFRGSPLSWGRRVQAARTLRQSRMVAPTQLSRETLSTRERPRRARGGSRRTLPMDAPQPTSALAATWDGWRGYAACREGGQSGISLVQRTRGLRKLRGLRGSGRSPFRADGQSTLLGSRKPVIGFRRTPVGGATSIPTATGARTRPARDRAPCDFTGDFRGSFANSFPDGSKDPS